LLAYLGVTHVSRIRRLAGTLSALTIAGGCIWPQPVNEEPAPPPPTDSAPTITDESPPIGPLNIDTTAVPGSCLITIFSVTAESPIGRQLVLRFYFNYLNGPANPTPALPFDINMVGDLSILPAVQHLPMKQVFELQQYEGQLLLGMPNSLWVWVSDGFMDSESPAALPGHYSTSFSWTFDLTQCPGIN
jgi:hypothetical protein